MSGRTMNGLLVVALLVAPVGAAAQDNPRWERRSGPTEAPVAVFHSTHAVNLPTAETLRKGEWLFEISHRFLPAVSDGADALWGFDGGVYNRLGLAYAASDRVMVGLLRTNLDDNLELNAKARLAEGASGSTSWMLGMKAGWAMNTQEPVGAEANESQAYAQVMANVLLGEQVAVGVVPTALYNPIIRASSKEWDYALGLHAQVYLSSQMSLLGEWVVTPEHDIDSAGQEHDGASFGIELETGGHFFKVILTNQTRMNPTQILAGAPVPFEPGEWRVGFNITRLLSF